MEFKQPEMCHFENKFHQRKFGIENPIVANILCISLSVMKRNGTRWIRTHPAQVDAAAVDPTPSGRPGPNTFGAKYEKYKFSKSVIRGSDHVT